jgi:hypothetical protein
VGTGSDLGHDAAVTRVLGLGVYDVGEDAAPVGLDYRRAGVVAGRFYRKDHGSGYSTLVVRVRVLSAPRRSS